MSDFNQQIIEEFRANHGKVGGNFEGAPMVLLTTTGARSGNQRTNPLVYLDDGDRWLIFASAAGADHHPAWYHNILAHPEVTIEIGDETIHAFAVPLEGAERGNEAYARQVEAMPGFGDYERKTTRTIPVVALTLGRLTDVAEASGAGASGTGGALVDDLVAVVGDAFVVSGSDIHPDLCHDECLTVAPSVPFAVVRPSSTAEVASVMSVAAAHGVAVTARGSGTGLSGAAVAGVDSLLVSFDRMSEIIEIDTDNHTATVQPGVTLDVLDAQLEPLGLVYPVFPGEYSASIGGNVNTNAGGMRAVKYGVTRHHVLGLELVLADGSVMRTGGKYVKSSTGYDLTQLVLGSEGTLALVTEVTVKLQPRLPHATTVLAPFATLDGVTAAVPRIVDSGIGPRVLEYIDLLTMSAMTAASNLELGIPDDVRESALAYLVVVLEASHPDRLDADVEALGHQLAELGALDVYVLPEGAAAQIIELRERAFFLAKANGANDIVDTVVPRATIPEFMAKVAALAAETGSWIAGCGHAGDGNVHLGIFQSDPVVLSQVLTGVFAAAVEVGGTISGEHGIGHAKRHYLAELEDPAKLELMRRIKAAFDPEGLLNPGVIF